jgi:uncharacterized protein (DUF58 family)
MDAGRTMHQSSYVGTKYAEAVAVAWLLVESTIRSRNPVYVSIYNESRILGVKGATAREQLVNLQELSLAEAHSSSTEAVECVPLSLSSTKRVPDSLRSERMAFFLRLLTSKLGLSYRKTGVYKALTEAMRMSPDGVFIVLTDLQRNVDALLAAVSWSKPGRTFRPADIRRKSSKIGRDSDPAQ